jgi:hypothetical protein
MTVSRYIGGAAGQASVELVALLPLIAAIALAAISLLAAHSAAEQAGEAAEAGALAILQERDPRAAIKSALPPGAYRRARVTIAGTRVDVHLRPALPLGLPGLADYLAADTRAEAGTAAAPGASR